MPAPPTTPEPPRYHAAVQHHASLHPGTVTARLTRMSPQLWEKVEALLQREGFRPY